jgi:type I site-specific restriction-modification system R (restriction) subunit
MDKEDRLKVLKTLRSTKHRIDLRKRFSESYIKCEFYHRLRLLGIEALPEYSHNGYRYDFLVALDGVPLVVIEAKKAGGKITEKQLKTYEGNPFGVPVLPLIGWQDLEPAIAEVCRMSRHILNTPRR